MKSLALFPRGEAITGAPRSLIAQFWLIDDPSDEAGSRLGVQIGAFIASAAARGSCTVSMALRRRSAAGG
jgi:hypothetical protein